MVSLRGRAVGITGAPRARGSTTIPTDSPGTTTTSTLAEVPSPSSRRRSARQSAVSFFEVL